MELEQFLSDVLPTSGVLIVARKVERTSPEGHVYSTFLHTCCESVEQVAEVVRKQSLPAQDVYFALAGYRQGFHTNAKGKKVVRVHENVGQLKALWLDVDYGAKKAYPDLPTAGAALKKFLTDSALPKPSHIVSTGGGLHVYWAFAEDVPVAQWQPLAEALKAATIELGLAADHACTADASRILRPPGTQNWKIPATPRPVTLAGSSGLLHQVDDLAAALQPWAGLSPQRRVSTVTTGPNSDLTGGIEARPREPSFFARLRQHCAVMGQMADSHGADCSEPEWVAALQLLRYCEDGVDYVHPISDGHPGYDQAATERKWEQRLANDAGPTLCSRFGEFRDKTCAKCPHRGHIKTPLELGRDGFVDPQKFPAGWVLLPGGKGVGQKMRLDTGEIVIEPRFRYVPSNLRAVRSIANGNYDLRFDVQVGSSEPWEIHLEGDALGNSRALAETLCQRGVMIHDDELKHIRKFMSSWISQLQDAKQVINVTDQLGWFVDEQKVTGFALVGQTYYADGRVRDDLKPSKEFAAIAKHYEPCGTLEEWKRVADFIATQDNPAFTATLCSAFAAPLLKFTGLSGGLLSLVSRESGVGKSSVLKAAQAVWGSPTHGINAVDDTPKSVARKLGFLNNLPAYWDELRGRNTVDAFMTLAFQLTQGKERTRLDMSANLREVQNWETMLVVASNDSIFDAMSKYAGGSDAGAVRVFEIEVDRVDHAENSAALAVMFAQLHENYGRAGTVYGQYLGTHQQEVAQLTNQRFQQLAKKVNMRSEERFWVAIAASIIAGAETAAKCGLVNVNLKHLISFLTKNIDKLRGRTTQHSDEQSVVELIAKFIADHGADTLHIDKLPSLGLSTSFYSPTLLDKPRSGKVLAVIAHEDKMLRTSRTTLHDWAARRGASPRRFMQDLERELNARKTRSQMGLGTIYQQPRAYTFDIPLDGTDIKLIPSDGSSRPSDSPGSETPTEPADSNNHSNPPG